MTEELPSQTAQKPKQSFSGMQVLWMVFASMCLAIVATALVIKLLLFPAPYKPVVLTPKESQLLTAKLEKFEGFKQQPAPGKSEYTKDGTLLPEQYSEVGSTRDIDFTERELNAMVAKNTDLADKVAIDLAEDMVSIKLLIPWMLIFRCLAEKR